MALCSCSRDEVSIDENIYKGIATRSIVPDEFDWEEVDVMPTPENQSTINLPWDGAGSLATTYGNDVLFDFKKNDGWTLLYNTFTTKSTAPLVNPYFILYNKYNGLLRVYLYTTTPFVTTSSSIESCISVNQDVNLLDFVGNDLVIMEGQVNANTKIFNQDKLMVESRLRQTNGTCYNMRWHMIHTFHKKVMHL